MRMVWRPKHALKTPKQPGHATIALTLTQRPPCESMQIPKDNLKPKGLREAKKQTTGASSAAIKHQLPASQGKTTNFLITYPVFSILL